MLLHPDVARLSAADGGRQREAAPQPDAPARAERRPWPGNPAVLRARRQRAGRAFVGSVATRTYHRSAAHGARIAKLYQRAARGASSKAANPAAIASPAVTIARSAGDRQPPSIARPSAMGRNRLPSVIGEGEACARYVFISAAEPARISRGAMK